MSGERHTDDCKVGDQIRASGGLLGYRQGGITVSTVDKKLMGQMLRFAKAVVITSANAKEGTSVADCEKPGKRDAEYLRAIMERGLRTLPLEQRVLSEAAFDKRAFDLGKVFVIRQLGIWEMMSYETLRRDSEYVAFPELLDGMEKEGLVKRIVDTVDGKDNDVVMLTETGKQMFSEQEEALEQRAEELFGNLTEGEKMQLYLLLRKVQGSPAYESESSADVRKRAGIA